MRSFLLVACASTALLLAACATPASESGTADAPPPATAEPADTTPPTPEAPTPETAAMTCDATKVQWTVGQLADEALVAKAKAESGSERLRVIKPNMAVTMDYREDRLNLDVDANNKVTSARCG